MNLAEQFMLQQMMQSSNPANPGASNSISSFGGGGTGMQGMMQLVLRLQELGLLDQRGSQLNLNSPVSGGGGVSGARSIVNAFQANVGNRLAEKPTITGGGMTTDAQGFQRVGARRGDVKTYGLLKEEPAPAPAAPAPPVHQSGKPLPPGYRPSPWPNMVYNDRGQLIHWSVLG